MPIMSDSAPLSTILSYVQERKVFDTPYTPITADNPFFEENREALDEIARQYREEGNAYFKNQIYMYAFHKYNKSAVIAASESVRALAFANRSAALFNMCKYEECLVDIEKAVKSGYDDKLLYKLQLRKTRCLQLLGKNFEGDLQKNLKIIEDNNNSGDEGKKLKDLIDREMAKPPPRGYPSIGEFTMGTIPIPTLSYGISDEVPSFSSAVTVTFDNDLGRHLVANRDVEIGDVLIVEEPVVASLHRSLANVICYGCFKVSYNLITCRGCYRFMYCSEECQQLSWKTGHKEECEFLPHIMESTANTGKHMHTLPCLHLALITRIIGIDKIKETSMKIKTMSISESDLRISGFKDGKFTFNLEALLSLKDNFDPKDAGQFLPLVYCSDRVSRISELEDLKEEATALLLKLYLIILYNHKPISYFSNNSALQIQGMRPGQSLFWDTCVGYGLYLASSLIKHSCEPNLHRVNHGTTAVYRACKPIKKGDILTELLFCYDEGQFGLEDQYFLGLKIGGDDGGKISREILKNKWKVSCKCDKCTDINYPSYSKLPDNPPDEEYNAMLKKAGFQDMPKEDLDKIQLYLSIGFPADVKSITPMLTLFKEICKSGQTKNKLFQKIKRCIYGAFSATGNSVLSEATSNILNCKQVLDYSVDGNVTKLGGSALAQLVADPNPLHYDQI